MRSLADPDVLGQLILWRLDDPRYSKEDYVQRQWTIEGRADFSDPEKNDIITAAFRRAAIHINATLALLNDSGVKSQVVVFSDDFMLGHEEISLLEDKLGDALTTHGDSIQEAQVSDEMLSAMRDMQHDDAK